MLPTDSKEVDLKRLADTYGGAYKDRGYGVFPTRPERVTRGGVEYVYSAFATDLFFKSGRFGNRIAFKPLDPSPSLYTFDWWDYEHYYRAVRGYNIRAESEEPVPSIAFRSGMYRAGGRYQEPIWWHHKRDEVDNKTGAVRVTVA